MFSCVGSVSNLVCVPGNCGKVVVLQVHCIEGKQPCPSNKLVSFERKCMMYICLQLFKLLTHTEVLGSVVQFVKHTVL